MKKITHILITLAVSLGAVNAFAQADKPNILVVWGDDIGQSNISQYTHGLMGYKTPNNDRIAQEGMTFAVAGVKEQIYRNVGAQ
jgi:hypothetical protein